MEKKLPFNKHNEKRKKSVYSNYSHSKLKYEIEDCYHHA